MTKGRQSGVTLVELVIAAALGVIVAGAAVQLYLQVMTTASVTTGKSLLQQDARDASNLMTRDISMAASGFQNSVGLASGTSFYPRYGCGPVNCYFGSVNGVIYPVSSGISYLYPIMPSSGTGITVNSNATDVITVTYADTDFLLSCYTAKVTNSTTVILTTTVACANNGVPSVTDAAVGLQVGDVVLFSGSTSNAGSTVNVVGTVTNTSGGASPYTVSFATNNNLNQPAATSGSFAACFAGGSTSCTGVATRLWVISYYVALDSGGIPNLMRQVNGQTPDPVAANVLQLKFSYDTYDVPTATVGVGIIPSLGSYMDIKQVHITHLTFRSATKGLKGYQGLDLQTSISVRNLGAKGLTN